jgi:hypothetical protein
VPEPALLAEEPPRDRLLADPEGCGQVGLGGPLLAV